jgi:hypothetical protein
MIHGETCEWEDFRFDVLVHLWTHKFQQNVSAFLVSGIILIILSLELIKILYGTL